MDNKSKKGKSDDSRININESYELQYWSEKLNVTRDRLKEAINATGSNADDVARYLKQKS
jgi:hypothetical protein